MYPRAYARTYLELVRERLGHEGISTLGGPQVGAREFVEHKQERLQHPAHAGDQQDREVQEGLSASHDHTKNTTHRGGGGM